MILSFHPCIHSDKNIIVAGRAPTRAEEGLIRRADAIILPQGVRHDLYEMCRSHSARVFPNYDLRFAYPGKIGDIRVFDAFRISHPKTLVFSNVAAYRRCHPLETSVLPFAPPFVIKGNTGGEGHLVFKIHDRGELARVLAMLAAMETSGFEGFLVQEWIDHGGRDLRVVVLHDERLIYWRVQPEPGKFLTNLSAGATIDDRSDPDLRQKAEELVSRFCQESGVNLAGIDVMFDRHDHTLEPLMVEINYWFGRRIFGSSRQYYLRLLAAIRTWLRGFDAGWPARTRLAGL
jgi:ribosomal protein S6--L-glutamate ligase